MVQIPSWEANWFAASQEIPHISRNPKVHYRTHKRPPPVSILGPPNPVHIPTWISRRYYYYYYCLREDLSTDLSRSILTVITSSILNIATFLTVKLQKTIMWNMLVCLWLLLVPNIHPAIHELLLSNKYGKKKLKNLPVLLHIKQTKAALFPKFQYRNFSPPWRSY